METAKPPTFMSAGGVFPEERLLGRRDDKSAPSNAEGNNKCSDTAALSVQKTPLFKQHN